MSHNSDYASHIFYIGSPAIVLPTIKNFKKLNLTETNTNNCFYLDYHLFQKITGNHAPTHSVKLFFLSDVFELVDKISKFNADFIIVDERHSFSEKEDNKEYKNKISDNFVPLQENENWDKIKYEDVKAALDKQVMPLFTQRRIVVVLQEDKQNKEREFYLRSTLVRSVITKPSDIFSIVSSLLHFPKPFQKTHPKAALCISGGGVEGYHYAAGVLLALEQSFAEKKCSDFDIFCGVSSGSWLATCMASGLAVKDLVKSIFGEKASIEPQKLTQLFDLAGHEFLKNTWSFVSKNSFLSLQDFFKTIQKWVPVGLFRGQKLKTYFSKQLSILGVEDSFHHLNKELFITATDQDTGETVVFGHEPWKDVKISQAMRASCALPSFFLPEKINGHWFIDGQVSGGPSLELAIQKGSGLVVSIDPIIPFSTQLPGEIMSRGGYFSVLQAIKSLVHSRSKTFHQHMFDNYPEVSFVPFSPTDTVMEKMSGNPMIYSHGTSLVSLGYYKTLADIVFSYEAMNHKFAPFGFSLRPLNEIKALIDMPMINS